MSKQLYVNDFLLYRRSRTALYGTTRPGVLCGWEMCHTTMYGMTDPSLPKLRGPHDLAEPVA
jgi:hypothetical protein